MSHVLRSLLPVHCVDIVKEYTGEGCWRNGKYINIHRIQKTDCRYEMLRKKTRIKQLCYDSMSGLMAGCAWFKLQSGKFIVINVMHGKIWNGNYYEVRDLWEMNYNQAKVRHLIL